MRLIHTICVLLFFLIGSCKNESQDATVESSSDENTSQEISKKEIEDLKYNEYLLSSDAANAVVDWQKYQELSTQIEYLKKADFSFFKSDITLITAFINDFKSELPKALNTNEINARITALETKILKLNSLLVLDNIPKSDQLEGLKEVFVSFSNLNLQINKKLEFEANNILKPE